MYLAGYYPESISNGSGGFRAVIFCSGCPHNCKGCHNKEAQSETYGEYFSKEKKLEILRDIENNPVLRGITLSGGEVFMPCNIKDMLTFTKEILTIKPDLNIWAYTGYKFENLMKRSCQYTQEMLYMLDVLVDGKFIEKRKTILPFIGSANQRIIDVKETLKTGGVVQYKL